MHSLIPTIVYRWNGHKNSIPDRSSFQQYICVVIFSIPPKSHAYLIKKYFFREQVTATDIQRNIRKRKKTALFAFKSVLVGYSSTIID